MIRTPMIQQLGTYMIRRIIKTKLTHLLILIAYRFNRTLVVGEKNIKNIDSFVLVTWHGKCLGVMEHFRKRNYHVLISQSRDGDIISDISKKFGYKLFRGSSNRGGKEAMKKMYEFFSLNPTGKLIITPDGPTGPEHKVKPGAFLLAKKSKKPVVPVIVDVKRSWKFKNWHTFYLSKPFSKMRVVYGKPIYFNETDGSDFGIQKIESALHEADQIACQHERR
ncbi:MAG: DUF374 domain-containing protein [Flammeovirgaceae bacterium TMED290]|nr:MAG: DUF374 domain-containing protein [Flammeovirgaceae bacterium TMED290]